MRPYLLAFGILVGLTTLRAGSINPQVIGLTISPSSPAANQPATVTVTGQGPCGAVYIDFGDSRPQTFPTGTLPFSTSRTWSTTGTKTITATGQGGCTGQASLTIQVVGHIAQLCATINCGERPAMAFPVPEIAATFGSSTPAGILAITGSNFGTKPGSVDAFLKTWRGVTIRRSLEVIDWTSTIVVARWPANIMRVRRQSATVTVRTAAGKRGWRSVPFNPELDLKSLHLDDVEVVSCGTDGNFDQCNWVRDPDDDPSWYLSPQTYADYWGPANLSILGFHRNEWAAVGDDTGTDVYRIALKNDWVMESFHWQVGADPGEAAARPPAGFVKGANWSPSVMWSVTQNDILRYIGVIMISGPVAVPHK